MKFSNILLAATAIFFAAGSFAQAKKPVPVDVTTVQRGEVTTISVTVKNPSRTEEKAAIVNVQGLNEAGSIVANLGMPVVVNPKGSLTVSREWQAPDYQTPLTWKAKVAIFREDPVAHSFGWTYPKLQHRMSDDAKNPVTCQNCHNIGEVNKDEPMNCYNCHGQKWY